ncbi:MAG TPA: ABC transporter permease [Pseudolysinimonas sp.]|nr:ABC transporter permease [Pseudolysinimonas sp.]
MTDSIAEQRSRRIATLPLAPVGRPRGFIVGTLASLRDIWGQRELIRLLVRRELRARYKDSSLGLLWSLMRPLAQLLIYYFAIGQVLGVARSIPSFAIFVFVGLTAWTLFTEIVSKGTTSIIANAGLVKKVYLPREVFPLANAGSAYFGFAAQFVILLIAAAVFGQFPLTPDVGYALLALLLITVFSLALSLVLAGVTVYLRDIEHLVEVVLIVLFWASPIVYSFQFVHHFLADKYAWLETVYLANPVTLAVLGMQRGLWVAGGEQQGVVNWPPDLAVRMWVAVGVSVVLLWLAQRIFSRIQGNFAQEL